MAFFEDVEVFQQRRRQQAEYIRRLQEEKELFVASSTSKVVEILREFASKAPLVVPHKFVLTPTHRRKLAFFDGSHSYRPVIEMPDVMLVEFGVGLAKIESSIRDWNEVYLDKAGRYHCCERIVVPYGEGSQKSFSLYKGILYERNLARSLLEAHIENNILEYSQINNNWTDLNTFLDFLVEQLDAYLADDR
ncbi:MAG: hypothetical protein K6T91_08790 [Firmicutes bacterium]|nr:hypothetical protein [Bacillota bacterium]